MDRQCDGENAVADTAHTVADTAHKESEAESQSKATQLDKEPATLNKRLSRTLVVAASLSIIVLGGAAAAAYALPSFNIALPNFSRFTELFSGASKPDPVLATLTDVQSRQQQTVAALHENGAALQRNTAMLQQSAAALESLRQDFTAQQTELKRLSGQVSSLIARVDALQNAIAPLATSSIREPKTRAQATLRKRTLLLTKPVGPVSVGGAPLSPVPPPGWGSG